MRNRSRYRYASRSHVTASTDVIAGEDSPSEAESYDEVEVRHNNDNPENF